MENEKEIVSKEAKLASGTAVDNKMHILTCDEIRKKESRLSKSLLSFYPPAAATPATMSTAPHTPIKRMGSPSSSAEANSVTKGITNT